MSEESEIFAKALALDEELRAELARQLILSLEGEGKEPGFDEALAAEIESRLDAVDRGEAQFLDWREFAERMRESISKASAVK